MSDVAESGPGIPASIEAEQALLGAILVNPACYDQAAEILQPEHFCEDLHTRIFTLMGELLEGAERVTPVLVDARLKGAPGYDEVGGSSYLVHLAASAVSTVNVGPYAETILDCARRRELMAIGQELYEGSRAEPAQAPEGLAETAAKAIEEVIETGARRAHWQTIGRAIETALAQADAAARGDRPPTVPLASRDLDRMMGGGGRPGELIYAAGRPGMGKTIFGLSAAIETAKAGKGVLFYSLEMPADDLQNRVISDQVHLRGENLPYAQIRKGEMTEHDWRAVNEARRELDRLPVLFNDDGGLTAAAIAASARARGRWLAAQGAPLALVVIDYLGLIKAGTRYAGKRVHEIEEISAQLKAMAKRLRVSVLCLSQLSRAVEQRTNKRPVLSDLRDSGAIEQDADAVLMLYRPFYYHEQEKPEKGEENYDDRMTAWTARAERIRFDLEMIVAKQRNGPTGTLHLWCDAACAAIRDRTGAA